MHVQLSRISATIDSQIILYKSFAVKTFRTRDQIVGNAIRSETFSKTRCWSEIAHIFF
jgi:hypothetical protein